MSMLVQTQVELARDAVVHDNTGLANDGIYCSAFVERFSGWELNRCSGRYAHFKILTVVARSCKEPSLIYF